MKESATAALSYVRSHAEELGIDPDFFENADIHVHLPAGAIPKDGPSAGVALCTALVSLLTRRKARSGIAMTGEITLRGRVLRVGGIKEKVMGAHRAGIRTVILPHENQSELEEVPVEARSHLIFVPVERIDQVLGLALEEKPMATAAAEAPAGGEPADRDEAEAPSAKEPHAPTRLPQDVTAHGWRPRPPA